MRRREFLKATTVLAGSAVAAPFVRPAYGQSRKDTLLALSENGPNNLDIMGVGTNRPGYEASWNTYDRLVSYGVKKDENGNDHYDGSKMQGELAEDWNLTDSSVTFHLRKNAMFHDGTPVTAQDVKWSFDRAVTVGGVPTFQMKAGSIEKPEQFVVVDDTPFASISSAAIGSPCPILRCQCRSSSIPVSPRSTPPSKTPGRWSG